MAVGANSYGTVDKLQALIGDLVSSRVFTTSTVPTLAQVEAFIDDIADEINGKLRANSYTVPVVVGTDPEAHGMLVLANTVGAASLVISMLPTESWTEPGQETPGLSRRKFYDARYKRVLEMIDVRTFPATKSFSDSFKAYTGSQLDRDTNETKLAMFKRSETDFPGSKTLQE